MRIGSTKITSHATRVQEFAWPTDHYDLVLGVWCLSYLNDSEVYLLLLNIKRGLKDGGMVVFNETILGDAEPEARQQEIVEK